MIHRHRSLSPLPGGNFGRHAIRDVQQTALAQLWEQRIITYDNLPHNVAELPYCKISCTQWIVLVHSVRLRSTSARSRPSPQTYNCLSHITVFTTWGRHSALRHTPFSVVTTRRQHTRSYDTALRLTSRLVFLVSVANVFQWSNAWIWWTVLYRVSG
jgi:hypothetical protein